MAIGPGEACAPNAAQTEAIAAIETFVDDELRRNYQGEDYFEVRLPVHADYLTKNVVIEKYREAGWRSVQVLSDKTKQVLAVGSKKWWL